MESADKSQARLQVLVRPAPALLALAAGLFVSPPTLAQYESPRNVGVWTVTASKDGQGCFLTREYSESGGTTLLLGLDTDGSNHLSVLNPNWSFKPKSQWSLSFRLSNGSYPKHGVIGIAVNGKQGFVTQFEAKFPAYFAASRFLYVDRGDVPVERLSLDGSRAAVAELRKCAGAVEAKTDQKPAETRRSLRVPKDPFAPSPSDEPNK